MASTALTSGMIDLSALIGVGVQDLQPRENSRAARPERISENVPEIIAWLAMIAAKTESTSRNKRIGPSGAMREERDCRRPAGPERRCAPWPK